MHQGGRITIDQPTPVADFPPRLAEAVAATLRAHGMTVEVADRGDAAEVLVAAARREEAVALMASQMDEIRSRVHGDPAAPTSSPAAPAGERAAGPDRGDEDEPARPLLSERLRRLWPVPVVLVPLLVLLGSGSVPANFAVLVLIGGMVALVAMRQRRRLR